jgi:hypothetical protein
MPVEWREGADGSADRRAAHGGHPEAHFHVPVVSGDSTLRGELVRRAVCGKSARTVPWGGAGVTRRSTRPRLGRVSGASRRAWGGMAEKG